MICFASPDLGSFLSLLSCEKKRILNGYSIAVALCQGVSIAPSKQMARFDMELTICGTDRPGTVGKAHWSETKNWGRPAGDMTV